MAEIAIALVQNAKPIDMSLIIYEIKGHTVCIRLLG